MYEFNLLQTIAFHFRVEHPYHSLLTIMKALKAQRELSQAAWNVVNDSLNTNLCLQYRPEAIACGAIWLASKLLNYELPESPKPWWELFKVRIDEVEGLLIFFFLPLFRYFPASVGILWVLQRIYTSRIYGKK